ncbi:MAG: DUF1178 domain-containing protein [Leptothrix sp. (in: Bacteria)]|nr:DUF1178 domain-containing protein [Leptothrix sp. (in: b-proteobacteria)]
MKVLNLRCANGHGFEGWFGSEADFLDQNGGGLIECPLCANRVVSRMPSAPRLNLSGAREPTPLPQAGVVKQPPAAAEVVASASVTGSVNGQPAPDVQAAWMAGVRQLLARTENVGERFAEEARRIHYGEAKNRGIRGHASAEEREALLDEGIETVAIPVPQALDGPLQ